MDLLDVLKRAADYPRYRSNGVCPREDSDDAKTLWTLVGQGLVDEGPRLDNGRQWFTITRAGLAFLRARMGR